MLSEENKASLAEDVASLMELRYEVTNVLKILGYDPKIIDKEMFLQTLILMRSL